MHENDHDRFVIIAPYVDYVLFLSNNTDLICKTKKFMCSKVCRVYQVEAHYILTIKLDVSHRSRRLNVYGDTLNRKIYLAVIVYLTYAITPTRPDLVSVV